MCQIKVDWIEMGEWSVSSKGGHGSIRPDISWKKSSWLIKVYEIERGRKVRLAATNYEHIQKREKKLTRTGLETRTRGK